MIHKSVLSEFQGWRNRFEASSLRKMADEAVELAVRKEEEEEREKEVRKEKKEEIERLKTWKASLELFWIIETGIVEDD